MGERVPGTLKAVPSAADPASMRVSAAVPEVATPRVVAMTLGAFLVIGGLVGALVDVALPQRHTTVGVVLDSIAACTVLSGLAALRWGSRFSRRAFHAIVLSASLVIALSVWLCPDPSTTLVLASLDVFVAIAAFFFFSVRDALAHMAVMVVTCSAALLRSPGISWAVAIALVTVLVAISVIVSRLVQLAAGAHRDSLTGLANRRAFDEALDAALTEADRQGLTLSVALLDVDHFKSVNDRHGHAAGDDLLRSIAVVCGRTLPAGALLARHGGDEFAVLLPGLDGERARAAVEALRMASTRNGLSCGVVEHLPRERAGDLMRRADAALYEAKAAGRGCCVLGAADGHGLVRDLAEAIASDSLGVVYQPIVDLANGAVIGVEALARWTHPERGIVSPADFIPAAESAGIIVELGAAVLARACRDALKLNVAWGGSLVLTVNVSGRQLTDPDFVRTVDTILATTNWRPSCLVLEVTESLLEGSSTTALATLAELRARGIAIAIDDFGTGYSTLSRLDTLPADYLKLDHSFIATVTTSTRRAGMLRALLSLSATLGLRVIAEGVETAEQAALLASLGCPLAQGYHFSRPRSASALLAARGPRSALAPRSR